MDMTQGNAGLELRRRWPRVFWAVRWAGVLTDAQAEAVLLAHRAASSSHLSEDLIRAGHLELIRAGIRNRHGARAARAHCQRTRIRERALQAFWSVVTEGYPEVRRGSLSYDAAINLMLAADAAIDCCASSQRTVGNRQE